MEARNAVNLQSLGKVHTNVSPSIRWYQWTRQGGYQTSLCYRLCPGTAISRIALMTLVGPKTSDLMQFTGLSTSNALAPTAHLASDEHIGILCKTIGKGKGEKRLLPARRSCKL